LLDTNPATAFNPFLGILGRNSEAAISRVYITLHATGQFELPLGYFHLDGDLCNLPAGPVAFAAGLEYHGERWRNEPDELSTSFNSIGALTLRDSYSEGFHAPTLPDLTPAGSAFLFTFPDNLHDPKGLTPEETTIRVIQTGNPLLKPEVAYEWSYGAVYSAKWIRGL